MRRILFLTSYYPPDLCPGSFRAKALVEALIAEGGKEVSIDVVTTCPNRYHTFSPDTVAPHEECNGQVRIRRIPIPVHRSRLVDQSWSFVWYALGVRSLVGKCEYDVVFATSSRLLTSLLGVHMAKRTSAALYLDVRDIFADSVCHVLPAGIGRVLAPVVDACEAWTIRHASRVNLVSPGFRTWYERRYPGLLFSCYTNGVDALSIPPLHEIDAETPPAGNDLPLKILYAGNIGEGQGLHRIIPRLSEELGERVRFRIIGGGGRVGRLKKVLAGRGNVEVLAPMDRAALQAEYRNADILFVHLNVHPAFERVLPSKLFEYAATGKPIWAGVGGYAAEFIAQEIENAVTFPPCDAAEALKVLGDLRLGTYPRDRFIGRWSRKDIMVPMAREIVRLAGRANGRRQVAWRGFGAVDDRSS